MAIKNTIYEVLINRGKIHSKTEIVALMNEYEEKFSIKVRKDLLKYLTRHKYIRRIFAGVYYVNSFDEKVRGFSQFEDKEVLFMVLNKLKVKWYVGLGYSIYLQGKTWQTPNQISIVNTKFSGIKKVFGLKVRFYKTKETLFFGLKRMKTEHEIDFLYSDPAKTYIDRVYFGETYDLIKVKNTQEYLKRYPKWVGKR
ncbi:hypothetical protein J4423_04965 [Candidatus Pacearchaeota archaeon]|nr:hypothetical protein [Candidatus Pacearchaeota archaeon]